MEIIGLRIDMQDTFCLTLLIHACDKGHGWLFGGNGNVCEGGQKSTACHFDCLKRRWWDTGTLNGLKMRQSQSHLGQEA